MMIKSTRQVIETFFVGLRLNLCDTKGFGQGNSSHGAIELGTSC